MRVRTRRPFVDRETNRMRPAGHVFECSAERAARLVSQGLVEEAGISAVWPPEPSASRQAAKPAPAPSRAEGPAECKVADGTAADAPQGEPTRAQLIAQAEALGVTVPAKANKNKIKELIADALEVRDVVLG